MPTRRRLLAGAAAASIGAAAGCSTDEPGPRPDGSTPPPTASARSTPAPPAPARPATADAAFDVVAENARPGDPDWGITGASPSNPSVEGWADRSSVPVGGAFGLHVSSRAGAFRVRAFRIGWYGGAGARLVWTSPTVAGRRQPAPRVAPVTRTARADWSRTLEVDTSGWPPGCYLLRLDAERGSGRRFVPLTVTAPDVRGRLVIINAPATWQAYNTWGGYSLYQGPDGALASRSLEVTLDRPYSQQHGAGLFAVYEQPLVQFAERLGLPVGYLTGPDVAGDPHALDGAVAMVSPGHDEYWSPEQRRHVTAARDAGTNLAVLGANACYRRIRLAPSDPSSGARPARTVVCYKGDYALDPGYRAGDPATTDYRLAPDRDPESRLLGVLYEGFPCDEPWRVSDPGAWVFAGTGVRAGESFPHLVGVEFDRVNPAYPTPRPIQVLAHSPVLMADGPTHADASWATLPAGAGVFASGTMRWVEALRARGPGRPGHDHGLDGRTGAFVRRVTATVLHTFAAGPAGRIHPATDDLDRVYG